MKSTRTAAYRRLLTLLKQARKAAGITQEELAKRLRVPQSFVSKTESGERRLDVIEFLEWSRGIRADPSMLLQQLPGGFADHRQTRKPRA